MNWLWAGGIIGALSAGWGYIKTLWAYISSLVIVKVMVQKRVVDAVLVYLQDNCWQVKMGPQYYLGEWVHVKSLNRTQLIAWRVLGKFGAPYFHGKKPLWISIGSDGYTDDSDLGYLSPSVLRISFVRGTFNADIFVENAVKYYNKIRDNAAPRTGTRHYIRRVYGLSKKRALIMRKDDNAPSEVKESFNGISHRGASPVGYDRHNLGIPIDHALGALALSDSVMEAILEARRWKTSEQWYKNHGLPWRRGWLLYGQPGTGKTALVRALAEELDLPVYIYDLASLANDEFQSAWREMLSSVPCIALIEDIDSVFDGRKTIAGDLTFDCLLNCLDGIERADGLFTIITTNRQDKLDSALGIADETGRSTRPGRVDKAILMDCPDERGRLKMAGRILAEYPDIWKDMVREGKGETGAQFQERCAAHALRLYWAKRDQIKEKET